MGISGRPYTPRRLRRPQEPAEPLLRAHSNSPLVRDEYSEVPSSVFSEPAISSLSLFVAEFGTSTVFEEVETLVVLVIALDSSEWEVFPVEKHIARHTDDVVRPDSVENPVSTGLWVCHFSLLSFLSTY